MGFRDALVMLFPEEIEKRSKELEGHRAEHAAALAAEAARRAEEASANPPAFAPFPFLAMFQIHAEPPMNADARPDAPANADARPSRRRGREETEGAETRAQRRRAADEGPPNDDAAPSPPQAIPGMPAGLPPVLQASISRLLGRAMEAMVERGQGGAPGAAVPPAGAFMQFQMGDEMPFTFQHLFPGAQPPRRR